MKRPSLEGRSILIVEDEPLIALDVTQALEAAGAKITSTNTLEHALILAEHDGLSAVILDHGLGKTDSNKICVRLKERGVPFLIYSGYTEIEGACKDVPRLRKPASDEMLVSAVEKLILG